ncbi:MAG: hypothetical protein JXB36_15575 [Gammaproteobacteria bacterium]|nr:hypothetical protein [Gammaproteobacteria bacterium]
MTANQIWAGVGSAVAVAAVAVGLYLAGSPSEERALRLDERRVADLQNLMVAIDNHWYASDSLPRDLDQLAVDQRMRRLPADPVTAEPYDYEVTGRNAFRLCAEFARPSRPAEDAGFWTHEAGRQCFEMSYPDPE